MKLYFLFLIPIFLFVNSIAQVNEFEGKPRIKISEGGNERVPEKIPSKDSKNLNCVITKIDDKFYWASRENTELVKVSSGAFITFIALNGSGYIRIIKPELKEAASMMGSTEENFDYVEHLLSGLRSVTYYGIAL